MTQLRHVEPWAVVRLPDNTPAVVTNTDKRGFRMVKIGRDKGRWVNKDDEVVVIHYAAELAHRFIEEGAAPTFDDLTALAVEAGDKLHWDHNRGGAMCQEGICVQCDAIRALEVCALHMVHTADLLAACKKAHEALITFEKLGLIVQEHERQALEMVRAVFANAYAPQPDQ